MFHGAVWLRVCLTADLLQENSGCEPSRKVNLANALISSHFVISASAAAPKKLCQKCN